MARKKQSAKLQRAAAQERTRLRRDTDSSGSLWTMLWATTRDEVTVEGWCSVPWQDVRSILRLISALESGPDAAPILAFFDKFVTYSREFDRDAYWEAQALRDDLVRTLVEHELLFAGLRCIELVSAKSDGGGWVFNYSLQRALEANVLRGAFTFDTIARHMLTARTYDTLGPNGDPLKVQAFREAWEAGRFRLAVLLG